MQGIPPNIIPTIIIPDIYEACIMTSLVFQQHDELYEKLLQYPPDSVQDYMDKIGAIEKQNNKAISFLEHTILEEIEPIKYKA